MLSVWSRLKERKLGQWGLAYLAGAWLVFQAVGQLAQTFNWGSAVERSGPERPRGLERR